MKSQSIKRIAQLKSFQEFQSHLESLGVSLPVLEAFDPAITGQTLPCSPISIGNRWSILPMEGWDGTSNGQPSELTIRRWQNFGRSGAKLIWGGEAVAVRHDGRANPNQLLLNEQNLSALSALPASLRLAHREALGDDSDLFVGLQLTHSGRFARPNQKDRLEPRILYRHPLLDPKFGIDTDDVILSDDDIHKLIEDFIQAAIWSEQAGFQFVDIKHCHGYLGHEFLSAFTRPGPFGGDFQNRTRFLREIVSGIQAKTKLKIGVRLSMYDTRPYQTGANNRGEPVPWHAEDYPFAFGADPHGLTIDLTETKQFIQLCRGLGVSLICTTAGSPYYTPHLQRPALFPPSDGYAPPEEPLVGVARQIEATKELKREAPELIFVGSGYSYLQEWLPYVAAAAIQQGAVDCVGLGRLVLSYPELPADLQQGRPIQTKKYCRTFSDCTTAPRHGMISGCYPLDPYYKERPEAGHLLEIKQGLKKPR